jgi:hypothetical protein
LSDSRNSSVLLGTIFGSEALAAALFHVNIDHVGELLDLLLHLPLVIDGVFDDLESHLLLLGNLISDGIALLVLLFLLIHHVDLEGLDGTGGSKPHLILLSLDFFVNREEDYLVGSLRLKDVHDLEALFIVLCLRFVVVHWELRKVFLVRLDHHTDEESACNSEEKLLAYPHEHYKSKNENVR